MYLRLFAFNGFTRLAGGSMSVAFASSPVEVDPAVDLPPKGADEWLALLSASCMAVCEHRERRRASLGINPLAGRIIYDYIPTHTSKTAHGRTTENTESKLSSCSLKA
jgi:hypothetical protein